MSLGGGALVLIAGIALLANALGEYRQYFYQPSDVAAQGFAPASDVFRVGGDVVEGSLMRMEGAEVLFSLRDFENSSSPSVDVTFEGALPDLFKEGSGAVVVGRWTGDRIVAEELRAKHDENYRPKLD